MGEKLPDQGYYIPTLAARIEEIKAINLELVEKEHGSRAYQRLPRHMQRRAMSNDPRRLPRSIREKNRREIGTKKKITKQPSRKYRRRPSNLLSDYSRRQRKNKWLETHIWHAKRFHMTHKWGYALPQTPTNKGYRATIRAAKETALIQDVSYECCFEVEAPHSSVEILFKSCLAPHNYEDFFEQNFTTGSEWNQATIFHSHKFPMGAIGKVDILFVPDINKDRIRLWLMCHPSIGAEMRQHLIEELDLTEEPQDSDLNDNKENIGKTNAQESSLKTPAENIIHNLKESSIETKPELSKKEIPKNFPFRKPSTYICATNPNIKLKVLSGTLNKFRLCGPLAHSILSNVVLPSNTNISLEKDSDCHDNADLLPSNSIFPSQKVSLLEEYWWVNYFKDSNQTVDVKLKNIDQLISETSNKDREASLKVGGTTKFNEFSEESMLIERFQTSETTNGVKVPCNSINKLSKTTTADKYSEIPNRKTCLENNFKAWEQLGNSKFSKKLVFGLVVRDTRCSLPQKKKSIQAITFKDSLQSEGSCTVSSGVLDSILPCPALFESKIREEVTSTMHTTDQVNKRRQKLLVPGCSLPISPEENRIPIVILCYPRHNAVKMGPMFDIILPAGWARPTWVSLCKNGAVAGGLAQHASLISEFSLPPHPFMFPDTECGRKYSALCEEEGRKKYFERPQNCRENFLRNGIQFPFGVDWGKLVLSLCPNKDDYFVLRDKCMLKILSQITCKKYWKINLQKSSGFQGKSLKKDEGEQMDVCKVVSPIRKDVKTGLENIIRESPLKKLRTEEIDLTLDSPMEKLLCPSLSTEKLPSPDLLTEKLPYLDLSTEKLPSPVLPTEKLPSLDLSTEKLLSPNLSTEKLPHTDLATGKLPSSNLSTGKLSSPNLSTEKLPSTDISRPTETISCQILPKEASSRKLKPASLDLLKTIPENALVYVRLILLGKGSLEPRATISLPLDDDLGTTDIVKCSSGNVECSVMEKLHDDCNVQARKDLKERHIKNRKRLSRLRRTVRNKEAGESTFITMKDPAVKLELDKMEERHKDLLHERSQYKSRMEDLWLYDKNLPMQQDCARKIFGYLVSGGFNMSSGRSAGLGYVVWANLKQLILRLNLKNSVGESKFQCKKTYTDDNKGYYTEQSSALRGANIAEQSKFQCEKVSTEQSSSNSETNSMREAKFQCKNANTEANKRSHSELSSTDGRTGESGTNAKLLNSTSHRDLSNQLFVLVRNPSSLVYRWARLVVLDKI